MKPVILKNACLTLVVATVVVCATLERARSGPSNSNDARPASDAATGPHHRLILPEQLEWKDGPPSLPPGCKVVVLEGDPANEGFFAMRARMPDGYSVPPHSHPGVERITVLSGTFHLGAGEKFDKSAAQAMPAGAYSSMQAGMKHFGWAEGDTVIQIATNGPWGITYVNSADDPRHK
jgi:quercetin dioxygenase-like cupin family protein